MTDEEIIKYLKNHKGTIDLVLSGFEIEFDDPEINKRAAQILIEKIAKTMIKEGKLKPVE